MDYSNNESYNIVSDYEDNYGNGWIKLYRSVINNKIWLAEKFTKGQAWVDLLMLAKHKSGMFMQRDVIVNYERGDVTDGIINLSKRWKWSRTKTQNYLDFLQKNSQIRQQKSTVITVISIVNYDQYQKTGQQEDSRKTAGRQQEDTNKKEKNVKNDNNYQSEKIAFDLFWNAYDKKVGDRTKIEKKWNNLSLETQQSILAYLPKYKKAQPDKKFRKNPETFLNQKSWNDELIGYEMDEKDKIREENAKILKMYGVE